MIVIKTSVENLPDKCANCQWYGTRPHPYKGWTDICELCGQSMDDDGPKDWLYDGNGRPANCPLAEIGDTEQEGNRKTAHWTMVDTKIAKCSNCGWRSSIKGVVDIKINADTVGLVKRFCEHCGCVMNREVVISDEV